METFFSLAALKGLPDGAGSATRLKSVRGSAYVFTCAGNVSLSYNVPITVLINPGRGDWHIQAKTGIWPIGKTREVASSCRLRIVVCPKNNKICIQFGAGLPQRMSGHVLCPVQQYFALINYSYG